MMNAILPCVVVLNVIGPFVRQYLIPYHNELKSIFQCQSLPSYSRICNKG